MNPLTLVKRIQSLNSKEAELGISEDASWHAKYKDSAYVYAGGIPFELTEGDLITVFAQYGEIVDINLVRDKATGKSKGFAFIAYEDQRSTILAVDNLNAAQIMGRTIRVDHVTKYKKKEEEDEETRQQKREERGVCRAFQKGECTRGAGCKFSHDEQRAANTGWGQPEDKDPRWGHDKFDGPKKNFKSGRALGSERDQSDWRKDQKTKRLEDDKYKSKSRDHDKEGGKRLDQYGGDKYERKSEDHYRREDNRQRKDKEDENENEQRTRDGGFRREENSSRRHEPYQFEPSSREDRDKREEKISRRYRDGEFEPRSREERDTKEEKRSRRHK